jgi:heme/copper-type cytochrome/quinol oxidase subunit 2
MNAETTGGQSGPPRAETEKGLVMQAVVVGAIVLVVLLMVFFGVI